MRTFIIIGVLFLMVCCVSNPVSQHPDNCRTCECLMNNPPSRQLASANVGFFSGIAGIAHALTYGAYYKDDSQIVLKGMSNDAYEDMMLRWKARASFYCNKKYKQSF